MPRVRTASGLSARDCLVWTRQKLACLSVPYSTTPTAGREVGYGFIVAVQPDASGQLLCLIKNLIVWYRVANLAEAGSVGG